MANAINKFQTGETYKTNSICDSNCWWSFKIVRRTAKSIWTEIDGKVERRAIYVYDGSEQFKPFGTYSMCPIVRAGRW